MCAQPCVVRYSRAMFLPAVALCLSAAGSAQEANLKVFNVRDYGATGTKVDNAQSPIQKAIDACAVAGGGMVYFPPGEYTSGTLHLRSHVRLHVEAGATLFSIKDKNAFDQDALIFGENLENITIEGRGTIDGQAEYEWRPDDIEDDFIRPNKELMLSLGKSTRRSFPKKVLPQNSWVDSGETGSAGFPRPHPGASFPSRVGAEVWPSTETPARG